MQKNTITAIKEKELEAETKIGKNKDVLNDEKRERERYWEEEERKILEEYAEKKKNISLELKDEFRKIDEKLSAVHQEREKEMKNRAKKNLEDFKKEIFKRV